MGHAIVLAHGVLGFGNPLGLPGINYFNGVEAYLKHLGHAVLVPQVDPVGTIEHRGDKLAAEIQHGFAPGVEVHIIAHSMGGLDARHAITNVFRGARPVKTLITIGTPHLGSPFADAIVERKGPIFELIPQFVLAEVERIGPALAQLTTGFCREFDASTHDVEGVRYIQVAGNAALGGDESFLFKLAAKIASPTGEINDGVVGRRSALRLRDHSDASAAVTQHSVEHTNLPDWAGDHAYEVGWKLRTPVPVPVGPILGLVKSLFPHLQRYEDLVNML